MPPARAIKTARSPRELNAFVIGTLTASSVFMANVSSAVFRPWVRPGTPGLFYVYAIYCRNDQAMSQTTAWTAATGP